METYSIFGITLASDFPFANRLARPVRQNGGAPDLTFRCTRQPPVAFDPSGPASYCSTYQNRAGESALLLYRFKGCDLLRLSGAADFYIWPEQIVCHLHEGGASYQAEIGLLGTALAYWLERRGVPALHAAAVAVEGRAAAFLSSNQGGKSSLAAALVQAGYALLTDDLLPVAEAETGFRAYPGYPAMRMWPGEAQHFTGGYEDLARVHPQLEKRRVVVGPGGFGQFCPTALPLACIYLPERRKAAEEDTEISILLVSPRQAVLALLQYSFAPRLAEAAGLAAQRLNLFARLAGQVPVRRLRYPEGYQHLAAVGEAVLADLARTAEAVTTNKK